MQPTTWAERAQAAADSVNEGFGHRILRVVPGTWIASIARPARKIGRPWDPWHYWWQAHYLDCLVDASWRQLGHDPSAQGDDPSRGGGPRELRLARALLASIKVRNFFQYRNAFYDDMAWLCLAADRAEHLTELVTHHGLRDARTVARTLGRQLVSANTSDGGGGLFWNTQRRFKNTPATSPAALFFARSGDRGRAQALVDWLHSTLFDPARGLYLDGINLNRDGTTELIEGIWTYNQGPVLGALVALGGPENLARAEALIAAVDAHLTVDWETHDGARGRALRGDGGGDGGLFMGILARYLTVAAVSRSVSPEARATARRLVVDTAEALWSGAEERQARRGAQGGETYWTFPQKPGQAASDEYPPGRRVELSTQLQAWMVLEFAHELTLERKPQRD
ncbi:glycoside hydrolase [Sinomonas cyclohexanicum]|uniref:Glycoside hydrolase n=1 Tax=Sinomonas cyclohexanicum TaxID=322009 RepID=A0ABN6FDJ9_SINCY|nr:glycoside hydrolase family 76 protein [Corynebacterium cyclohexanicum]BCT74788.1 glycoside hydrolase [Corynebacterium cyclohexanicum]